MRNDLTNLLPHERRDALSRDYFLRLGVVVVLFATALTLMSMVLLLPTYVLLAKSAGVKKAHLVNIESVFSSADEAALSARLATLSSNAATLAAISDAPFVSAIIRAVLAISHPGITLSGFSYVPATEKSAGNALILSGFSATRGALRNYQLALQEAPFALSAVLPVSAYAKDSDIAFTITVTVAP